MLYNVLFQFLNHIVVTKHIIIMDDIRKQLDEYKSSNKDPRSDAGLFELMSISCRLEQQMQKDMPGYENDMEDCQMKTLIKAQQAGPEAFRDTLLSLGKPEVDKQIEDSEEVQQLLVRVLIHELSEPKLPKQIDGCPPNIQELMEKLRTPELMKLIDDSEEIQELLKQHSRLLRVMLCFPLKDMEKKLQECEDQMKQNPNFEPLLRPRLCEAHASLESARNKYRIHEVQLEEYESKLADCIMALKCKM